MLQYALTSKALCWENEARKRRPHIVRCHLQEMFRTDRPGETENRWLFSRGLVGGYREKGSNCKWVHRMEENIWKSYIWQVIYIQNKNCWASLVLQWLKVCFATQRTLVWSLVQSLVSFAVEQLSHCITTTEALALEPVSRNYWSHAPQLLKLALEPVLCNKRSSAMRSLCTTTGE